VSDQHVVPLDDLREHEACPECWCGPREDSDGVWVHNRLGTAGIFRVSEFFRIT